MKRHAFNDGKGILKIQENSFRNHGAEQFETYVLAGKPLSEEEGTVRWTSLY